MIVYGAAAQGGFVAKPPLAPGDEIVVTGSRLASPPDDLAAGVTVLSREDFGAAKPRQFADVLRRVAGLHIDQVGGRGGVGSLYLRGADPNYTLVLVDGVRVNDPTNSRGGSFDFSSFDVADVERVEIARGPYSAVYGGDALAGVVNIITRRAPPESPRLTLDAMGGAYDVRELAVSGEGPIGAHSWRFGASDAHEGEVTRGNDFGAQRVSGSLNLGFGGGIEGFVTGRYSETSRAAFPDDSGGYDFADIRSTEQRDSDEAVFGASFGAQAGEVSLALQAGYLVRNDHVDSPGVAPGVRDPFGTPASVVDTRFKRSSATLIGARKFSEFLSLAYGIDWLREEGASIGALDFGGGLVLPTSFTLTRDAWAPYAEARLASRTGLSLQAGVRVDQPEDSASVTSPRVRLAYQIADSGFAVAGAWGRAFKLPSLYALSHPLVGNPDLAPERGESYELELSQRLLDGRAHWSAVWFDGEFRNAIDFESGPPPMLVNRARVDTQGFELAGSVDAGEQWFLEASVTRTHSRVAADAELRNRPKWRAGAEARWRPTTALQFSLAATHIGSTLDSSIPTGDVRLDAYTRIDASASWRISNGFETWLAVDNLTSQRYEEFVGFMVRGIAPRAGVRFSF